MTRAVNQPPALRKVFASLFAPIAQPLEAVEAMLHEQLRSDDPFVDQLLKHGFRLGGKRLRPALLLLAGQAAGRLGQEHIVLATVVEMIHTATLIHDDVLDSASMRRHLDTVNVRWGNQSSVLLGDFLFSHAFYLASTLGSTQACQSIGRSTNIVCEGELRQINSRGNLELTEDEYLAIIDAKTAELCSCACQLGAHYAGAPPEQVTALADYGRDLGMAFQIVDDLLDMLGDEATAGKSLGTDLEQQKLTLPIIRLLATSEGPRRKEILSALSGEAGQRLEALRPWLLENDCLEYARARAEAYSARANRHLERLAPSPAVEMLQQLTSRVIDRWQ